MLLQYCLGTDTGGGEGGFGIDLRFFCNYSGTIVAKILFYTSYERFYFLYPMMLSGHLGKGY